MNRITTVNDLRNWVDAATTNWDGRTDNDLSLLVDEIRQGDHPRYGTDWSEYLDSLDLQAIVLG